MGQKTKSLNDICNQVELMINNNVKKNEYKTLYLELVNALQEKIIYSEIEKLCDIIKKLSITKNRALRSVENDLWEFIIKVPFQLIFIEGLKVNENESLNSNYDYNNAGKNVLAKLLGFSKEILESYDNKSKSSDNRRANALRIISSLMDFYEVKEAKEIFQKSITSVNKEEQLTSLIGLENYFNTTGEKIDNSFKQKLNEIFEKTDDRTIAATCLQIQMNAGIIDELTAVIEMDDWKEKHYNY